MTTIPAPALATPMPAPVYARGTLAMYDGALVTVISGNTPMPEWTGDYTPTTVDIQFHTKKRGRGLYLTVFAIDLTPIAE